jgi:hypothetical protein
MKVIGNYRVKTRGRLVDVWMRANSRLESMLLRPDGQAFPLQRHEFGDIVAGMEDPFPRLRLKDSDTL